LQEEEEAEEEEDVRADGKSLGDSIASFKWRESEGTAWGGSTDPIKQQKLQQAASIKRYALDNLAFICCACPC
jgi:hypothetical protein